VDLLPGLESRLGTADTSQGIAPRILLNPDSANRLHPETFGSLKELLQKGGELNSLTAFRSDCLLPACLPRASLGQTRPHSDTLL